jgi:hypothetical protein
VQTRVGGIAGLQCDKTVRLLLLLIIPFRELIVFNRKQQHPYLSQNEDELHQVVGSYRSLAIGFFGGSRNR